MRARQDIPSSAASNQARIGSGTTEQTNTWKGLASHPRSIIRSTNPRPDQLDGSHPTGKTFWCHRDHTMGADLPLGPGSPPDADPPDADHRARTSEIRLGDRRGAGGGDEPGRRQALRARGGSEPLPFPSTTRWPGCSRQRSRPSLRQGRRTVGDAVVAFRVKGGDASAITAKTDNVFLKPNAARLSSGGKYATGQS